MSTIDNNNEKMFQILGKGPNVTSKIKVDTLEVSNFTKFHYYYT